MTKRAKTDIKGGIGGLAFDTVLKIYWESFFKYLGMEDKTETKIIAKTITRTEMQAYNIIGLPFHLVKVPLTSLSLPSKGKF